MDSLQAIGRETQRRRGRRVKSWGKVGLTRVTSQILGEAVKKLSMEKWKYVIDNKTL